MVCHLPPRARHRSLFVAVMLLGLTCPVLAEPTASPVVSVAVSDEVTGGGAAGVDVDVPQLPPSTSVDVEEVPPPFTTDEAGGFLWSFVKSMFMLALVLGLAYLVLHQGLGRLVQRTQGGRRVRVVERVPLEQRRSLYLVEVDGQEILLAGTDGGITPIPTWRPRGAGSEANGRDFSEEMRRVGRTFEGSEGLPGLKASTGTATSSREKVEG
ncbi:MAG: FliO/MopB family protein [Myxococcota bacterium]